MRLLKWIFIGLFVAIIALVGAAWHQMVALKDSLTAEAPLSVPEVHITQEERKTLVRVVATEASAPDRTVRLNGQHLTWLVTDLLGRPEVHQAIEEAGVQIGKALDEIPFMPGDTRALEPNNLKLDEARSLVQIDGDVLTVKTTVPYKHAPVHLNVELAVSGRWQPDGGRLEPLRLALGGRDLLAAPLYGGELRRELRDAISEALSGKGDSTQGSVESVEVASDQLQVVLKPEAAASVTQAVQQAMGR